MWRLELTVALLVCSLLAAAKAVSIDSEQEQGFVDEEAEAIVIEAPSQRSGRQLNPINVGANLFTKVVTPSPVLDLLRDTPCLRKDRALGRCMSLKSCYPYFKIHDFRPEETYVMGLYDTCSYQSPQGRQIFGVCCNNTLPDELPEEPESQAIEDEEAVVDEYPIQGQQSRRSCGYRNVQLPQVTLYGQQSPVVNPLLRYLQPSPYIVNGAEAVPHEFPWMVALLNHQRQFCGGSLIDDNHILTAAHCVAHMSKYDVQNLRVRLGDHNIRAEDYQDGATVDKKVRRVIRHKGFSSSTLWHDVAILTLEDDVQYTNNIQPICLATGKQDYVGEEVTVAGWGTLTEGGRQPNNLMKVDVHVWTNQRCKDSYGSSAPGGITNHMLCAADPNRDSCSGDSGGPLFVCEDGYSGSCEQIGIVSWGIGCAKAQYPGVYTRVTEMIPWIQRIIREY